MDLTNPMARPVLIPLLNPNEPESRLVFLGVSAGQQVSPGDLLGTFETTKSTADLTAEADGYVVGLRLEEGQVGEAGEIFCYLAESPDWTPSEIGRSAEGTGAQERPLEPETAIPAGLRITQPALALARQHSLDLGKLPRGPLVTEKMVQEKVHTASSLSIPETNFDPMAIIVYGGGGHGKSLIDLIRLSGAYRLVGIVDDGINSAETVMGLPVLGGSEALPTLFRQGVRLAANAVGGIGNLQIRTKIFHRLSQAGFACPALVHPAAFVETSAQLGAGVQVLPQAYVGSEARLGFGVIVNTGAVVSHDCIVGDYANISPGALIAGAVIIEEGALIGMGVTVNLGVKVGAGARIGNGATVKEDVPSQAIVRAGAIWPA